MIDLNIKVKTTGVDDLIALLSTIESVDDTSLMEEIINRGIQLLKEEAGSVDFKFSSGADIIADMNGSVISPTKGVLFNNNPKMAFIEFGTGLTGEGTSMVDTTVLTAMGWKYDNGEHGAGWWYPVEKEPPIGQPSFYDPVKAQWYAWTRGQEAKNIFYNALIRLNNELPSIIAERHIKKIQK